MTVFKGSSVRFFAPAESFIPGKLDELDTAQFVDVPTEPLKLEPFTVTNRNVFVDPYEILRLAVDKVSFGFLPYRIKFKVERYSAISLALPELTTFVEVRHRDEGQPIWIELRRVFDAHHQANAFLFIRQCVRDLLLHEIDEMMIVDGERIFDPHKEK